MVDLCNAAMKYGLANEEIARRQYEREYSTEVKICGLFVDKDKPFLCASPDGLVEQRWETCFDTRATLLGAETQKGCTFLKSFLVVVAAAYPPEIGKPTKDLVAQIVRKSPPKPSNASRRQLDKQEDEKHWQRGNRNTMGREEQESFHYSGTS
ncbi:hypothetical protein TNCV_2062671 [Trichonephila clavipes]|nr:hypothetical protein TNCV_2062671 [Trichonephila clavipes]